MVFIRDLELWIIFMIIGQVSAVSYNQPKFCPDASWNPNAITFADNNTVGSLPAGIFVNTNNTIYVADYQNGRIQVWFNNSTNLTKTISGSFSTAYGLFVTTNGDVYVDNGNSYGRVDKWALDANTSVPAMYVDSSCWSLFVDVNDTLYCSMHDLYIVVTKPLNSTLNMTTIVAGNGTAGSTSTMLCNPEGIFVDINFDLYVADGGNNRIQRFRLGQLNATTVAGGASSNTTITLYCPTGIVLDADNYLFIVDQDNYRLIGSGPNGFRCLVGCNGTGSSSSQLYYPKTLRFDSYGNMFVTDRNNNRIQKFLLLTNSCAVSYNQPKFCPNASWNPNAITFANSSTVGSHPEGIFVNTNNTIYVADYQNGRIQVWFNNSINPTQTISGSLSNPYALFVTSNGDIYVDNGNSNGRVDKWTLNANTSVPAMYVNESCHGLFVDVNDTLYCSMHALHKVVTKPLNSTLNMTTISAGTGTAGNTNTRLNNPEGIFVDINFDLYVADSSNARIQRFRFGQSNGTTVAGNRSANITIALHYPSGIVLDADKYLFIADNQNHRIVGSGPNGFRCLVGCHGNGSSASQLYYPNTLSFDSYGNMFVADQWNNRIQKFLLSTNSCNEYTTQQSTIMEVESSANTIESTVSTVFHQEETTHETSTLMDMSDFTSIFSTDQSKTTEIPLSSTFFIPSRRCRYQQIGPTCNISSAPCDILQPCQNNSTCGNNNSVPDGYTCSCSQGFNGTTCQIDNRLCKSNTCWNNGICNETSNGTFKCLCQSGWTGIHCETKINYCENVTCLNNGVCRPLLLNFTCECLGTSFSGRYCEIVANTMVLRRIASKSFGYISILFIGGIVIFFVIMDVLKYGFGIDPTKDELEKIRRKKRAKKAKPPPVIQRFVYVHASPPQSIAE